MNVLLFTVHRTLNYGSVLQTFACKEIFSRLGIDMIVADYTRPTDYSIESVSSVYKYFLLRKRIRGAYSPAALLKCLVTSIASYPFTKKFWENCNSYLTSHVELTKPLISRRDLETEANKYDFLCSGSDQIWNSDYNYGTDDIFMLSFAPDQITKFSLASSIGKDTLSGQDTGRMKKYLTSYKGISVREKKAKDLLNTIDIKAEQVLDPTLWLDKKFWDIQVADRIVKEPYILLYKLKADDAIDSIAQTIAEKFGKKIVRVCFSNIASRENGNSENIILPQVNEFLSLIKHADFVVTKSFHGTCFSINFNKPFISVARERFNSRIESILELLSIEDRLCYSAADLNLHDLDAIDFDSINRVLIGQRERCFSWLTKVITE